MIRDTRPRMGTGELRDTGPTIRESEPLRLHDTQPIERKDLVEIQRDALVEEILRRKLRDLIIERSEQPLDESTITQMIVGYDPGEKEVLRKRILLEDRVTLDLLAEVHFDNQRLLQRADRHPLTLLAKSERAQKIFESNKESRDFLSPERAMVMVRFDLDGFKKINDKLGHAAGDETLKRVAEELKIAFLKVRRTDLAIHFSGDEFGLLLSGVKQKKGKDGKKQTIEQTVEEIVGRYIAAIEKITLPNGENLTASAGFKIINADNVSKGNFTSFNHEADMGAMLAKKCKNIPEFKKGSLRVVNSDEPEEKFLERRGISKVELEESATRG
ncbi:MAG: diguanylate cyclase, partial [Candidatus Magasanikbacteria bacterium]|nr:diguanylate cyclase [Candidatus Magasanikbacteria bacterium]